MQLFRSGQGQYYSIVTQYAVDIDRVKGCGEPLWRCTSPLLAFALLSNTFRVMEHDRMHPDFVYTAL